MLEGRATILVIAEDGKYQLAASSPNPSPLACPVSKNILEATFLEERLGFVEKTMTHSMLLVKRLALKTRFAVIGFEILTRKVLQLVS
jgi:hypothetical protein